MVHPSLRHAPDVTYTLYSSRTRTDDHSCTSLYILQIQRDAPLEDNYILRDQYTVVYTVGAVLLYRVMHVMIYPRNQENIYNGHHVQQILGSIP